MPFKIQSVLGLICSLLLSLTYVVAQENVTLSGKITDSSGKAIAYASVVIDNAAFGTISNDSGNYEIRIPVGSHQLMISHIGYRRLIETINIESALELNYQLEEELLELEDVIITADGKDPAFGIMRQAIANKKANARPFPLYQYQAYTKASIGFQEGFDMDSIFGSLQIMASGNGMEATTEDSESGADFLYLSENISRVTIQEPNDQKEEILSSRVSGASDQFSFAGNLFTRYDPYENRTVVEGIADRGIVSPLSDNAFFFYNFKLLGTTKEDGIKYYKIQLLPKRKNDPAWEGTIYIVDGSYAIKEIDWTIDASRPMQILDKWTLKQEFQPLQGKWIPFKTQYDFELNLEIFMVKLPFTGQSVSISTDYVLDPGLEKRFFSKEIIAISDSALTQNMDYWQDIRPIPLSLKEENDYRYKDSLETVQNSDEYLDSLTKVSRKLKLTDPIFGKTFRNHRKKRYWQINSLLQTSGFNAQESGFFQTGFGHGWEFEKGKSFELSTKLRYSIGQKRLGYHLQMEWDGNRKTDTFFQLSGGDYPSQFSPFNQIMFFENAFLAGFFHINHIKLYRKRYLEARYRRELFNGFNVRLFAGYHNREGMANTSERSFFRRDRTYEPNLPLEPQQIAIANIRLSFRPFNEYISTPDDKIDLGSRFPLFTFSFQKGFPIDAERDPDYERITLGVSATQRLGLLGNLKWRATAGRFLNHKNLSLPDLFHFKGNETPFHFTSFDEFLLMPYYSTSSTSSFVEAHAEHAFDGFIMNKLPLLRRLKMKSFLGVHALWQEGQTPYIEVNAGLSKNVLRFLPLRLDAVWRVSGASEGERFGVRWVFPLSLQ